MQKRNKIKALVVEDNEKWRKAIVLAIKNLGCEVDKVEDADSANNYLYLDREKKTVNILILDWDLRSGNVDSESGLSTALGADVLVEVSDGKRNDLTVVIITGALHDPDYMDWRKKDGIKPVDDAFKMAEWQPFLIIPKKKIESELEIGLPTLTNILKEKKLLENVYHKLGLSSDDKPSPPQPEPTYRYYWTDDGSADALVDRNGLKIVTLPPRLAFVIREILSKDPQIKGKQNKLFITKLSYRKVAELYVEGWGIEQKPKMDEGKLKNKIKEKSLQIDESPEKIAYQFRQDLYKLLKKKGLKPKRIIKNDQKDSSYGLVRDGWDWGKGNPVLKSSEVGLIFLENIDEQPTYESKRKNQGKKYDS